MNKRKSDVGKTMQYIRDREANGLPIPPTMQRGTKEYVKSSYWSTLNQRCVNGLHFNDTTRNASYKRKAILLEITKEQFCDWVDSEWNIFELLYSSGRTPSIDRKDNAIGYRLDNMQVVDLKENMSKDRTKAVIGISNFTGEIKRYESAISAEIDGFNCKSISRAIKLKGNHKGFAWRFE